MPDAPPEKDKEDDKKIPNSLHGYGFDKKAVRAVIERYFRVYEERDALPGFDRALLVAFYVLADKPQIEAKLGDLHKELERLDPQLQPMLREEGGETLIVVARRPPETRATKSPLPVVLALLTLVAVTLAGSMYWMSYHGEHRLAAMLHTDNLLGGLLYFTLPLAFFFLVQEAARRIVAARHRTRIKTSLLIPVPPILFVPPIPSFGGVTNPHGAAANRRALFDVSAAGPLAGFAAAALITIVGFSLTTTGGVPAPDDIELEMVVIAPNDTTWREGEDGIFDPFTRSVPEEPHAAHNITVEYRAETAGRGYGTSEWRILVVPHGVGRDGVDHTLTWQALGPDDALLATNTTTERITETQNVTYTFEIPADTRALAAVLEYRVPDRTSVPLGQPLAFTAIEKITMHDDGLLLHPTAVAGWTAFFITGIMLLPVGRLDGGGVARAVLGERVKFLGYVTLGGLVVLTLMYAGWVYLLLVIVLFLNVRHGVPLDDTTPLDTLRRVLAFVLILVLVVSFVPLPSPMEGLGFLR